MKKTFFLILTLLFSVWICAQNQNAPKLTVSFGIGDYDHWSQVGDFVTYTVTVGNSANTDLKDITVACTLPYQLVSADPKVHNIPVLAAGESKTITLLCRAIEAGRGKAYCKVTADRFVYPLSLPISIAGAGWYGGDCHTHSNLSDGSGTVRQNADSSYSKGMSFIYITDHNDTRAQVETERINAEKIGNFAIVRGSERINVKNRHDFIAIMGMEVDNNEGHANCYQIPYDIKSETYLFYRYPIYEGFFEIFSKDAAEPIKIPFRDTNLEFNDAYFAEMFGDKPYELVWVPGYGRAKDLEGWDLTGKIALISRGENEFSTKIKNAMKAGALAAVIYDARTSVFNLILEKGLYGVSITKADGERLTKLTDSTGGVAGQIKFNRAVLPPKPEPRGEKTWQEMIDGINATGGFFMPVHPADKTYPFLNTYTIKNHVGLEVWNGANGLYETNVKARKYWDDLNTRGEYKYVGLSNTDAHSAAGVANTYNMCYLDSLTINNINNAMKSGATYGTNGVQLRFDIAGVPMGQTLKITGDQQNMPIYIRVFDNNHPLTKIELYKFKITGEAENTKEVVKSWDLTNKNIHSWDTILNYEVSSGEFYRLEAQSAKAAVGSVAGFACSNPIWIEKTSGASNRTGITNITLNNSAAELLQTEAGNYYIVCNNPNSIKGNQLIISAAQGVRVIRAYDVKNKVFYVSLKSPDGSNKRVVKIFVVSAL